MKNLLNFIVKWAPAIIGTYILFAMFRALFYYLPFNIPIYSYVDLDEIFTIWFFPTIVYFIIFCIPLIFIVFIIGLKQGTDSYLYYNSLPYLLYVLFFVYVLFLLFYPNRDTNSFALNSNLLGFSLIFFMLASPFFIKGLYRLLTNYKKVKKGEVEMSKVNAWAIIISISINIFIVSIFFQLNADIASVSASENYEIIFVGEHTLTTDDNLRYLGKTKNYFFLFDKNIGKTFIYKNDDIVSIRIESDQSRKLFSH